MSKIDITTSLLYRWRYQIGYTIILILLVSLLAVAGFLIPNGLTEQELKGIITSSQLVPSELWHNTPFNAPFYLLQHVTLSLFGVTLIGIKLPSLLLALITAICMVLLLRRWFTPGIAVLASLLAITTGQFLFLAQQGTVGILYLFWPTVLLLLATLVAKRVRYSTVWKILFFIVAALSLYTPLSIYVLIALGSAIALHPHLRYIVRRLSRMRIIIGIVVALALITPLVLTIIREPSMLLTLLGIPNEWTGLLANISELARQYFGFLSLGDKSIMLPLFGLGSALIITYGLYRLVRSRETVQSYVILAWLVLLLPVLIMNPVFISIMFVPLLLLLATGLEGILRNWYGIFPRNPYARIAGLLPLIVLVSSMVLFGLERYGYGYRYAPDIVQNFSRDILIIPDTSVLVVTDDELPLYQALSRYGSGISVTTKQPSQGAYAITAAAYTGKKIPATVVTTERIDDAARFYVYK